MRFLRWLSLGGLVAGCSSSVSSGLPPLVNACQTAADCSIAGPSFQCVDGGCMILACTCDLQCADAGLRCFHGFQCLYQPDAGTPCDGG